ncbi:MAG TPA: DUF748 domain-containing protein, partial [Bacteroidota bacterium]|nr:DUF748 domain-containing protein [Bacteroidota bacterium]
VAFRLVLPSIVKSYVNRTINEMPGYQGYVDDVDMHLYRGAYVIQGITIEKMNANVPVPFVSIDKLDLSIEWSALFHGALVGEIEFVHPKINFVQGPSKKESQSGENGNFTQTIKKLFPMRINRFDVTRGEVHFRNFHSDPKVDIYIDSIFVHAKNLTNSEHLSKSLVASIDASGKAMGWGALKSHLDIDPYAQRPTFNLDFQLAEVPLTRLNNFFKAYVLVDVESGTLEVTSEMAASEGAFRGYVKPLFKDMKILNIKEDVKNPLKLVWETIVEGVTKLFQNRSTDKVGTRIALSGTFDDPNTDILSILGGLLQNAFIKALQPGLEGTISLKPPPRK